MRTDTFLSLPPSTALLVLNVSLACSAYASSHAYTSPRRAGSSRTAVLAYQALNVATWPLLPTDAPPNPFEDLLQRQNTNTICGYIGGNPGLPATCSAGSHCALDTGHGVIGCCPDGKETCVSGVFTSCVDGNTGPQSAVDPYVVTCSGGNVCFRNLFDGGFSQFGCGTASSLATTVLGSATGITQSLDRPTISFSFTQSPPAVPAASSTGLSRATASLGSTSSSSLTIIPSATTPSSTSLTAALPTAAPAAGDATRASTATIVGSAIGVVGAAALAAVLLCYLWRGGAPGHDAPDGPGPEVDGSLGGRGGPTESVNLKSGGGGAGAVLFSPGHQTNDAYESGPAPPAPPHHNGEAYGVTGLSRGVHSGSSSYKSVLDPRPRLESSLEGEQMPLTREMNDFSRGFNDALGRIGEEDEGGSGNEVPAQQDNDPNGGDSSRDAGVASGTGAGATSYRGNMRPLWQQNRRQSRTLMWV